MAANGFLIGAHSGLLPPPVALANRANATSGRCWGASGRATGWWWHRRVRAAVRGRGDGSRRNTLRGPLGRRLPLRTPASSAVSVQGCRVWVGGRVPPTPASGAVRDRGPGCGQCPNPSRVTGFVGAARPSGRALGGLRVVPECDTACRIRRRSGRGALGCGWWPCPSRRDGFRARWGVRWAGCGWCPNTPRAAHSAAQGGPQGNTRALAAQRLRPGSSMQPEVNKYAGFPAISGRLR